MLTDHRLSSHLLFHRLFTALLLAAWLCIPAARAEAVRTPHVTAELIAEQAAIVPGKPFTVGLSLEIIEHWHTYWKNPGDSGLPSKIRWQLPEGFSAGPIQWPAPKRLPLGPLTNFGYEGRVLLPTELTAPASLKPGETVRLAARAEWLVCSDVCIPEKADLSLAAPVAAGTAAPPGPAAARFAVTRAALPRVSSDWRSQVELRDGMALIDLRPVRGEATLTGAMFFPDREGLIENAAPQALSPIPGGQRLAVRLAAPAPTDPSLLSGVVVAQPGFAHGPALQIGTPPVATALVFDPRVPGDTASATVVRSGPASRLSLGLAIAFALAGGVLLNLMPCVFPVLGIKVLGFVSAAHGDARGARRLGMLFLAGVVVSFWALAGALLALRAGGEAVGWGFQLQSPVFVSALAILFLLLALNLAGVFEMGLRLQTLAGDALQGSRSAGREAFATGVLATLIATPCTAPFMGSALGFTLAQPAAVSLAVFTALALGMAAPVALLACFPRWLERLPRPGRWMETFRQAMAFPLFATVAWLAWILGAQAGNDAVLRLLLGLTLVAVAAWVYGRWGMRRFALAAPAAALIAVLGGIVAWPSSMAPVATFAHQPGELAWEPWSKARLAELRAQGRPVFVDFTAAWCVTCQVNKRVALHDAAVVQRFAQGGIVPLKADWTRADPAITAALAEFGRNAVPLYVFYPAGVGQAPRVLPEVLTPGIVLAEIDAQGPRVAAR